MSLRRAALIGGAVLLGLLLVLARREAPAPPLPDHPRGPVALIDHAHHPLAPTPAALHESLRRHGAVPLAAPRWRKSALERARLLVLPPSFSPLSPAQVDELSRLLEGGGLALVAVRPGWGDSSWLVRFGIRLTHQPLGDGAGTPAAPEAPAADFASAWGLELSGAAQPLVRLRGVPVVAQAAVGDGRLVVVADGSFLELGGPRNLAFADWLWRQAR